MLAPTLGRCPSQVEHDHPNALVFLRKDCENTIAFYRRHGVTDVPSLQPLFDFVTDPRIRSEDAAEAFRAIMAESDPMAAPAGPLSPTDASTCVSEATEPTAAAETGHGSGADRQVVGSTVASERRLPIAPPAVPEALTQPVYASIGTSGGAYAQLSHTAEPLAATVAAAEASCSEDAETAKASSLAEGATEAAAAKEAAAAAEAEAAAAAAAEAEVQEAVFAQMHIPRTMEEVRLERRSLPITPNPAPITITPHLIRRRCP